LSKEQAVQVYQSHQDKISLRGYCNLTGFPRACLRYQLEAQEQRQARSVQQAQEQEQVKEVALKHQTYGYRGVYIELNKLYCLGREKVRKHMAALEFKKERPKRKRKPAPEFASVCDLPAGRKLQIDATRFELKEGIAWKYLVQDVASRACLAIHTVPRLSQETASGTLLEAEQVLRQQGITDVLVIQSDGGSDFTSHHFQETCLSLGASWHRCKVSEKGGMGILERLNRTLKWDFVFWHEVETIKDLQQLDQPFIDWYNNQRIHSAIHYQTPWNKLLEDVRLSYPVG
jgi:putative transposase